MAKLSTLSQTSSDKAKIVAQILLKYKQKKLKETLEDIQPHVAQARLDTRSQKLTQQDFCTMEVGFSRCFWHIQRPTDLCKAQLTQVA